MLLIEIPNFNNHATPNILNVQLGLFVSSPAWRMNEFRKKPTALLIIVINYCAKIPEISLKSLEISSCMHEPQLF
jgi:hypothetical protein